MPRLKSTRPPYAPRAFLLAHEDALQRAIAAIRNAPLDPLRPLQVLLREEPKKRRPDQNAAYWAGPLRDISEQAWFGDRQYSQEVLHEYFKREFLPDDALPIDDGIVNDGYRKWEFDPSGERVLVGSTTMLTTRGFSIFMEQVHAFGANLGVQFSAPPGLTGDR